MAVDHSRVQARANGVTTRAVILAVLRNAGTRPLELPPSSTRFVVTDPDGSEEASGTFTYVMPSRLWPGERAYAVEVLPAIFAAPDDLADVAIEAAPVAADAKAVSLSIEDLTWDVQDGYPSAGGTVVATSGQAASPFVAVVLLDDAEQPLAVLYDLDVAALPAGGSARFETDYPRGVPIRPGDVARVVGIAYDTTLAG